MTILLCHSLDLDSDLHALQLSHSQCINMALIFIIHTDDPLKLGLAWLTCKWLGCTIKDCGPGRHDPKEDVWACGDLLKAKTKYGVCPSHSIRKLIKDQLRARLQWALGWLRSDPHTYCTLAITYIPMVLAAVHVLPLLWWLTLVILAPGMAQDDPDQIKDQSVHKAIRSMPLSLTSHFLSTLPLTNPLAMMNMPIAIPHWTCITTVPFFGPRNSRALPLRVPVFFKDCRGTHRASAHYHTLLSSPQASLTTTNLGLGIATCRSLSKWRWRTPRAETQNISSSVCLSADTTDWPFCATTAHKV